MAENRSGGAGLERSLGLTASILVTVGAIIGSGIFVAIGPTADGAGSGLLLAMVLAGAVALMNGIISSQLGINHRFRRYLRLCARGREAGFRVHRGSAFLGKEVIGLSVIALTFATYSAQVIPGLPVHIVAAGAMIAVTVLNVVGLEATTRVLIGLTFLKVGALAAYVAFATPAVEPAEFTPMLGEGPVAILAGAGIFFFAFSGYSRTATIAEEIKDPETNIPRGIILGFAASALLFLLVGAVTLGVLGPEDTGATDAPVFDAAVAAVGRWGGWVIVAAAWLATLSVLVGGILGASRVAMAMGEEHELPGWFSEVHSRFRTPHRAVIVLGLASAALALVFNLRPLLEITNVFVLVYYSITNFAALQLSSDQRTLWSVFSWLGLLGCLALLSSLPWTALLIAAGAIAALLAVRRFVL